MESPLRTRLLHDTNIFVPLCIVCMPKKKKKRNTFFSFLTAVEIRSLPLRRPCSCCTTRTPLCTSNLDKVRTPMAQRSWSATDVSVSSGFPTNNFGIHSLRQCECAIYNRAAFTIDRIYRECIVQRQRRDRVNVYIPRLRNLFRGIPYTKWHLTLVSLTKPLYAQQVADHL
ncbi:hypothetical protein BKA93DRAFT_212237 [Sparassis latifolia]